MMTNQEGSVLVIAKSRGNTLTADLELLKVTPVQNLVQDSKDVQLSQRRWRTVKQLVILGATLYGMSLFIQLMLWLMGDRFLPFTLYAFILRLSPILLPFYFLWQDRRITKAKERVSGKFLELISVPLHGSIETHNKRIQELIDAVNIELALDTEGVVTTELITKIEEQLGVIKVRRDHLQQANAQYDLIRNADKGLVNGLQLLTDNGQLLLEEDQDPLQSIVEQINTKVAVQVR